MRLHSVAMPLKLSLITVAGVDAMGRKGGYLFKRKGSQNWWIRFQYTGELKERFGPKREHSLGTPDRLEAEVKAQQYIFEHKATLLLHRSNKIAPLFDESTIRQGYSPGLHIKSNGDRFYATEKELTYLKDDGSVCRTTSNEMIKANLKATKKDYDEVMRHFNAAYPDDDIKFLHNWIKVRNINRHISNEALETWKIFKVIVDNKKLKNCKRHDGRKLVDELYKKGNKSSTVEKKVGHLRAAINIAISDNILSFNPFENIFEKRDDRMRRDILEEYDMKLMRTNLHRLSSSDQLLWKLLSQTGMRLDEPFQITKLYIKEGVRCVQVGTKTASSNRLIPLPTSLYANIPKVIDGKLFTGGSETAGKRLRYLLRQLGISYNKETGLGDRRKVIHSLRHRAKDRLRELKCPLDVQYEILGH